MQTKSFSDTVLLPRKKDVLRLHLYLKFLQFGIKPFENDINIILELYSFGGYKTKEEQEKFIQICLDKKLKRSAQSVRNTLSTYVTRKVCDKPRKSVLSLNEKFIPRIECDKLVLQHIVSH